MVTDRDAGSTSSHSDFSFRLPPVPALGGIASSDYVSKLGSSLRRARAHALPVRAQPAPLSAPYFDAHGWQARAAAGPDAGEGSRPRDPSFPEPSPLVDPVIRIRP